MANKRIQVMKISMKSHIAINLTDAESVAKATKAFADLKTAANDLGFSIEDSSATFGNAEVEAG